MTKLIFDNLEFFPEWLKTLILFTWGALFVAVPIYIVIAYAQKEPIKVFFKTVQSLLSKMGESLRHQVDDPIKYPKIQAVLEWCMIGISYILSIILFISFIVLLLMWAFSSKKLSPLQELGVISYLMVCVYFSAVLKTQGNRLLLKAKKNNA